jgi:hypothetical protein
LVGAVFALWPARSPEVVEQSTELAVDQSRQSEGMPTGEEGQQ